MDVGGALMSQTKHEDWKLVAIDEAGHTYVVREGDGTPLCQATSGIGRTQARRLVACWNACIGLSTEALGGGVLRNLIDQARWLSGLSGLRESLTEPTRNALAKLEGK